MCRPKAVFIHDTKRIIAVNDAACELFKCEAWQLIDRDMLELVPDEYKDLTRLNLYTTRRGQGTVIKTRNYDFVRCDGSIFNADVDSFQLDDREFETTVTFRYEVSKPNA